MQNGVMLSGGVSTGRTSVDTCEVLFGYNPANPGAWRRPNEILQGRFVKFGVRLDF